ncbi:hypothetical protein NT239_10055 [Chitinibacter sp. SCUT-21]|uniref:hypothetical protein n=1 Tax=Chitinibacter sp. SCUT-21 TaxID=2970891 RepID=UPI0035A721B1
MADSRNYLADFIQSPGNITLLLAGLATAVICSFPFGLVGAAFPLLATVALETLACLFIPDMPSFRAWANQRRLQQKTAMSSERMLDEIFAKCGSKQTAREIEQMFAMLGQQVRSLIEHASEQTGILNGTDLQKIQSVPTQYLSLRLSLLSIDERAASVDLRKISAKLNDLNAQISKPALGADVRQLSRARDEYQNLLARHQRMLSRRSAIEAAVLTLPDQLAEIYQLVMSNSSERDGIRLTDAISNLQLRQEIEDEIADELNFNLEATPNKTMARTKQAQR